MKKPLILLADDDKLNYKLLDLKMRQSEEFELLYAVNGAEALELLKEHPEVDLLLTDLRMPKMDGFELLAESKKLSPGRPVIVISAFDEPSNIRQAMRAGAFDFAPKPIDMFDLMGSVHRALAQYNRERLAQAELSRFRATLDLTEGGLFLLESESLQAIYANRGGLEMLGLTQEELAQQDLFSLSGDLDRGWLREQLSALGSGRSRRILYEYWISDGRTPVEAVLQKVTLSGGEQRLVLDLHDITARKQALAQIQMLAKAVEQSQDVIVVTDNLGKILYVNPAFERETGYAPEEAIGKTPALLSSGRHTQAFYEALWNQILAGNSWHGEFLNRRKDGKLYYAEATISPICDEKNQVIQFVGVSRDKTRERQLHAQLMQSQKMESIGTLAGGIAHEINNPIGFVHSNLSSLQAYVADFLKLLKLYHDLEVFMDSPDAKTRQMLQEIDEYKRKIDLDFLVQDLPGLLKDTLEGADRVKGIVRNLKEFSHVGTKVLEEIDLRDGIEKTLKLLSNELKYRIEVKWEGQPLPKVYCYVQEIKQVFLNLIHNAAQAIEDKGTITIKTEVQGAYAVVRIRDTGCGIEEEHLSRLFEPFFTTKGVGQGTGLGLSVSYNIIKRHKGKIMVESKPGIGTQFTLRLPINPEKVPDEEGGGK